MIAVTTLAEAPQPRMVPAALAVMADILARGVHQAHPAAARHLNQQAVDVIHRVVAVAILVPPAAANLLLPLLLAAVVILLHKVLRRKQSQLMLHPLVVIQALAISEPVPSSPCHPRG